MGRLKELVNVECTCIQPPGDRRAVKLQGPNRFKVWVPLSLIDERDAAYERGQPVVISLPRWKARELDDQYG